MSNADGITRNVIAKSINSPNTSAGASKTTLSSTDTSDVGGVYRRPSDWSTLLECFKLNPYHQRAVNIKALLSVGLGYDVTKPDGAVDDALKTKWDAMWPEGFSASIHRIAVDLETYGNAFIEIANSGKTPVACYHVPSLTMYVKQSTGSAATASTPALPGFRQEWESKKTDFSAFGSGADREILHLKLYGPGASVYGEPDWISALNSIFLDVHATQWNSGFFQNNCVPAYAITLKDGNLTPEAEGQIRDFFTASFKGVENARKTLIMAANGSEVKFEKLQADVQDMGFERLKEICRNEVVAAHGVPPRLLGIMSAGQLGGGGELQWQLKLFKEGLVAARQALYESALGQLLPEAGLRFKEMDVTDIKDDMQYFSTLVGAGIILPNEARAELGFDKVDMLDSAALARALGGGAGGATGA